MSKERIKELLAQLRDEIRTTDIDDELEQLIGKLDDDIDAMSDEDDGADSLVDLSRKRKVIQASCLCRPGLNRAAAITSSNETLPDA